jgi:hypothetical protein
MNDYRAAGQELQSQVMAAARKGQERVHSTVKTVRAAADQIRPQLANLPKPNLPRPSSLPSPAQLRERAPELVTKLPTRLQTKLPKPEQLRAGAEELAGHARSVRRVVIGQVASVAAPLAQQAATRLAQIKQISEPVNGKASTSGESGTAAKSSTASQPHSTGSKPHSTGSKPRSTAARSRSTGTTTRVSKVTVTSDAKPDGTTKSSSSAKPKAKPAAKPTDNPAAKPADK